ncbi:MAG: FG-GAP repeat domain-containing protein, partial [bacterium]
YDLNNDGYSDIISAFLSEDNKNLSIFYYNKTKKDFDKKISSIPLINETIETFFLIPLDYDADGDYDIITYAYDENHFNLFENKVCNLTSCQEETNFVKINSSDYINASFFEDKKIKSLNVFDENSDGFPDLYYIVDKGPRDDSTRDLEFGHFLNKHRRMNHSFSISTPKIKNFTFIHSSTQLINESWKNYSGEDNYFYIEIEKSNYSLSTGRKQTNNIFYNLNISYDNYSSGDYFTNNYDYNSQKGNLLYRNKFNLTIPNRFLNFTLQAEAPNLLRSNVSKTYNYTNKIEYCDGYDNTGDGVIDGAFNYTWPDGNKTLVREGFDYDGDGYFPKYYNISHVANISGNITEYKVSFNCTPKMQNQFPGENKYDPDDYNSNILPSSIDEDIKTIDSGKNTGNTGGVYITNQEEIEEEEIEEENLEEKPTEKSNDQSSSINNENSFEKKIIKELSNKKFNHKRSIEDYNGKTVISEEMKNIDIYPLNKINMTIKIPKFISKSAKEIKSPNEFQIIEMDPIIEFDLGKLDSFRKKTIQYKFDKEITEENAKKIQTIISYNMTEEEKEQIDKNFNDTKKALNISQKSEIKNNKTIITLDLETENETTMYNVSVFQEIPKCLIEIINKEIAESDVEFEILNSDPLIVWHFDKLIDKQKIQLSINSVSDSNCNDKITTAALAKQIIFSEKNINYNKVIIGILIVPLLALIFVILLNLTKDENKETKNKYIVTKLRKFFNKIHLKIHEVILFILIMLNILDFIELLPGDIDYFKKILSWIILGYVLYDVSITSIVTGRKEPIIDIALILSFFMLTLKNLVGFAKVAIHEVNFMEDLYSFIWKYNTIFEVNLFILGIAGIIICSYFLAKTEARNPSIIATFIKKENFIKNFILIFIVLSGFFITVFNLMFEWLAIAVDAFILISTMIFTIFVILKHHKNFKNKNEILEEISEDSEKFYEKVISLFHYKKFIPLAFSGLLILFMLTEIANFLIPYLTGIYDIIYFG